MGHPTPRAARAIVGTAIAALSLAGCGSILDVKNPNNVPEASLTDPLAADQQSNGVLASTSRMLAAVTTPYATATDELDWIGSRESWKDLEKGAIGNPLNEFTDAAFPFVGEARYLGDETVKRLAAFQQAGTLRSPLSLARAYLYTAVTYGTIADMFSDFAFSSKSQARPPVGPDRMVALYDTAIVYLDRALPIAEAQRNAELRYAVLATRARTKHARAVWLLVHPKKAVPANPLVNDAGAAADGAAALAVGFAPAAFRMTSPVDAQPGITVFNEVNSRNEMKVGDVYQKLVDPISGTPDASLQRLAAEFRGAPLGSPATSAARQSGSFIIVSDRELRLIAAEAALARGDVATFTAQINTVRASDGKPAYAAQVTPLAILKHERMANLWLQRRRLSDLYRFGDKVREWATDPNFESAANTSGLYFPIPLIETSSNPCILDPTNAACSK